MFVTGFHGINVKATQACDRVSRYISLAEGAEMIAQRQKKPCTSDIAECLLDGKPAKEITALPGSNNAVTF